MFAGCCLMYCCNIIVKIMSINIQITATFILMILMNNSTDAQIKSIAVNSDNFGPYKLQVKSATQCRGPKVRNSTTTNIWISNANHVAINITFLEDTNIAKAQVLVYTKSFDPKNELWRYVTTRPCQHLIFIDHLKSVLKPGRNCLVKKGTYPMTFNITQVVHKFHGGSFFYGDLFYRLVAVGQRGNVLCFSYNLLFEKKT